MDKDDTNKYLNKKREYLDKASSIDPDDVFFNSMATQIAESAKDFCVNIGKCYEYGSEELTAMFLSGVMSAIIIENTPDVDRALSLFKRTTEYIESNILAVDGAISK
jgi:hypothetical protein